MSKKEIKRTLAYDAIVIGSGFAGIYMLYQLRKIGLSAIVLEKGFGIGGTWFWNKYPGARCDTESLQYSYQFSEELQQEWEWTEKYATQPEILKYINHVVDRFNLRKDIKLKTEIKEIIYNDEKKIWLVSSSDEQYKSKFCIMATGCLSTPNKPNIPGLNEFKGEVYQTSLWPNKKISFTNKNIAVIGTGSSAMQAIPIISKKAKNLYVFQRTSNYAVPAHNRELDPKEVMNFKKNYKENREKAKTLVSGFLTDYNHKSALQVSQDELKKEYDKRWKKGGLAFLAAFTDIAINKKANKTTSDYIEKKIQEIVYDKKIAKLLTPNSIVGCKRLVIDTDYYKTFNNKNVYLFNAKKYPISKVDETQIYTEEAIKNIDMIILATGFDAMTGAMKQINIVGKNGIKLETKWKNGPKLYLGLATNGFPNFFIITGPGSPSVLTNMIPTIEQHVDWIAECLTYMKKKSVSTIEAKVDAENDWVDYNEKIARNTLRYNCKSWYLGSNIKGKKRIFMPFVGGLPVYIKKCEEIVANNYAGFEIN
jgi:cation diffusion facilitator CzcD-associated flavoprotein CzcO